MNPINIIESDFNSAWSKLVSQILKSGEQSIIGDPNNQHPIIGLPGMITLKNNAIKQIESFEIHPDYPFKAIQQYVDQFTYEWDIKNGTGGFDYTYFSRFTDYGNRNYNILDQLDNLRYGLQSQINNDMSSNRNHAITWMPDLDSGAKAPPCYDKETEVLTKDGWKYFKDIIYYDEIATLNEQTNELEYQYPTKIINYNYNGKMNLCETPTINFNVTPNHNMYVRKSSQNNYELIESGSLPKQGCYVKSDSIWNGVEQDNIIIGDKSINMDSFLQLMAIYLADGSFTYTSKNKRIRFMTKRNIKLFREILNNLHPDYNVLEYNGECGTKNVGCIEFCINNKDLALYMSQFGKSKDKFIPNFIKNLSSRQINIFLSIAKFCDSSKKRNSITFNTISKRLADDLQELIIKSNVKCNCNIWKRNNVEYYEVRMTPRKHGLMLKRDKNIKSINYDEIVYCVEVPNHIIMVRRNGKAIWCGNCLQSCNVKYVDNNQVDIFLYWRSRDAYTAWQSNIIAITQMLNKYVIKSNNCTIRSYIEFCNSYHIYESDINAASKVKSIPLNPQMNYQ